MTYADTVYNSGENFFDHYIGQFIHELQLSDYAISFVDKNSSAKHGNLCIVGWVYVDFSNFWTLLTSSKHVNMN